MKVNESKSWKSDRINEKRLLVSVDVGKSTNTGYARSPSGEELKVFDFPNKGEGYIAFWNRVRSYQDSQGLCEMEVGLESTGCYGEPLVHYLRKQPGVRVVQVNPMHTKRLKELTGNSPSKTDEKDPRVIADLMELGHTLSHVVPEGASAELRRLSQARERHGERLKVLWNQVHSLVFLLFPELVHQLKSLKRKSSRLILWRCPLPHQVVELGVDELSFQLRRVSRGQLGEKEARALVEAGRHSGGIQEGVSSLVLELHQLLSLIDELDEYVVELESQMASQLRSIPYHQSLLSLKGVGLVTACGLIGEVGDFRSYRTLSELVKLSGLDLYEESSGQHQGRRRISKRGRPLLRKLLYFTALNMVKSGCAFHPHYQRYVARGMVRMKALIAISKKVLRVLYALVRDESSFDPSYHEEGFQKVA